MIEHEPPFIYSLDSNNIVAFALMQLFNNACFALSLTFSESDQVGTNVSLRVISSLFVLFFSPSLKGLG